MKRCQACRNAWAADAAGLCRECIRRFRDPCMVGRLHIPYRKAWGLPATPPCSRGGIRCRLCANECEMGEGDRGYCGLREVRGGRLVHAVPRGHLAGFAYLDPLPTNCCASWFCRGSRETGRSLAVFLYGCNFDCLFCQNSSHRNVGNAPLLSEEDLMDLVLLPDTRCICFFGGSPEPQLPAAIAVARRIVKETGGSAHICWEWNGAGHPANVRRAAELSDVSGGTVKFDLKAYDEAIHTALTGQGNRRVLENFSSIAKRRRGEGLLTATTLLVPLYIDRAEVEGIARFIAEQDSGIPYSLLAFHPHSALRDLPFTPRQQAEECLKAARAHLDRVHLGNAHLIR